LLVLYLGSDKISINFNGFSEVILANLRVLGFRFFYRVLFFFIIGYFFYKTGIILGRNRFDLEVLFPNCYKAPARLTEIAVELVEITPQVTSEVIISEGVFFTFKNIVYYYRVRFLAINTARLSYCFFGAWACLGYSHCEALP
jgi:hypothetical protein